MYQEKRRTLLASSLYDGIEHCNLRHVMTILHEKKGDPNAILPWKGISPFHLAVGCDNEIFAEDVTKLLLQFGGHPNTRSLDGMTPVHIAAAWGRTNLLHLLLLNGGDPWLFDEEGNDAFDYAYQGEYSDSVELLNRFIKLDAKSPNQADVTPKFKVTLDKVMLYNRNAILEYKTDTQFAPTQSRQLKCATTQTSPRENELEYDGFSDFGKYTKKRGKDSDKMASELPETKFNSVLADLKDNNVTLRRGKRKKYFNVNVSEEKESLTQPEKSHVSGESLYDELKAVTFVEENKEDPKKTQSLLHGSHRSLKCGVKEWQLNSIKKTGKSPSVSEMTLIDELKKWQANSVTKLANSLDSPNKNVDDRTEILQTADSKHTLKQTDHFGDKSFLEELKEWQADGFKNLKKPNCSNSIETPSNWMEELKERQAEGLRDNIKQLSLEASKTQLVTSEVMVRVNPIALEDGQECIQYKRPSDFVQEDLVVEPNQPSGITLIMKPVLRTEGESTFDLSNETVDKAIESISPMVEEDADQPCKLHVPFEKLYGFTLQDEETFSKDMLSDGEDAKVSTTLEEKESPLRGISPRSCELHRLLPDNSNEAVRDVLHVVDVPISEIGNHFMEACHEDVKDLKAVLATIASPDFVEQVDESAMPAGECTTKPAVVWEELSGDSLSECGMQNDTDFMLNSSHQITEELDDYIAIPESSAPKSIIANAKIQSKNEFEESMNEIISILPSEATFRRHLVDLSNNVGTSSKKQFLDLDDWMTMDWMDHDEPLPNSGLRFKDDDLFGNSDDDMPRILSMEQDKSVLTENTSKSVRSSPDYFTCSEEILTLARYPGGKPKVPKVLHFQNMTVTSLPNISQENCDNSLSIGMLQPTIGEGQFLTKTQSYEQISIQSVTSIQVQNTTGSSLSDTDSFVSVSEDYIYTDEEEGVVLLERRYLVPEPNLSSSDQGTSLNSSSAGSGSYDTDTLRTELKRRGLDPGPIIPSTKRVYVKRLRRLARNPETLPENKPVYSPELERTLRTENWHLDVSTNENLERQVALQFAEPDASRHWRQGVIKSSFCYLLLDPRVTCNLPCRTDTTPQPKIWSSFLEAIFYVGKGKRSRPYSHLYQAVSVWKTGTTSSDHKIQHILDIWRDGVGVVCLHIFQNTIPVEAYTREAAMIDALKLCNLKNARLSEYYGVAATWPSHKKKLLGVYLLYKAMLIFLNEGERQLRPADIGH